GAEIPVRLRREIERSRRAVLPHLDVVRGALADRHARMGQIRQLQKRDLALTLDRIELESHLLDLLRALAVRGLHGRGVETLTLGARDLVAGCVLLALQSLELGNEPAPRRLQRGDLFERLVRIDAARAEPLTDFFDVIAYVRRIEH